MNIKVLSWNIWKGKHLKEVIEFLKTTKADVIGLQEVVGETTAQKIANQLGYEYTYFTAFTTNRHETIFDLGISILSKYPIKHATCHFLSTMDAYEQNAQTEPRIAVEAEIEINGILLHVFTVHLAY